MTSINRVGEKHGQLTVIYEVLPKKKNTRVWRCICSCGVETTVYGCNLSNGHTKSCGCYRESGDAHITHGTSNRNKKTNSTKKYHALFSKKDRLGCDASDMALWILQNPPINGKHLTAKNPWLKLSPENAIYRTNEEACNNKKMSMWWFVNGEKYESCKQAAESHGVTRCSIQRWVKARRNGCYVEYKYPQLKQIRWAA